MAPPEVRKEVLARATRGDGATSGLVRTTVPGKDPNLVEVTKTPDGETRTRIKADKEDGAEWRGDPRPKA